MTYPLVPLPLPAITAIKLRIYFRFKFLILITFAFCGLNLKFRLTLTLQSSITDQLDYYRVNDSSVGLSLIVDTVQPDINFEIKDLI